MTMTGDNPAYDLKEALLLIRGATKGNPIRLAIVFDRIAGLSLAEIGRNYNISRQAVEKHLVVLEEEAPELGDFLRSIGPNGLIKTVLMKG